MAVICQSDGEGDNNFRATATDSAGNAGPTGSLKVTRDDVAPTVEVSAVSPNLKAGQDDRIDFNFSEPVGRLHQQPRDRVGRHARRPLPGDLTHYFATFTPDANIDATTATIQVSASAVPGSDAPVWFDLAGNPGTASNTVSISEDKTPTAISIAASGPGITNGNSDLNSGKVVTLTLT